MLKISRLADYATIVMSILTSKEKGCFSAAEVARVTALSTATVSKVLKYLNESRLVISERGVNGGYRLARAPESISLADIITAIDGKPAMTQCSRNDNSCEYDAACSLRNNWKLINDRIYEVLDSLSLADMRQPLSESQRLNVGNCTSCQCEGRCKST